MLHSCLQPLHHPTLTQVSEILDQWITLQRQWMYLEPIFSSEDIMQQLPLEGKRFATVDRGWRKVLEGAKRNPLVLKVRWMLGTLAERQAECAAMLGTCAMRDLIDPIRW